MNKIAGFGADAMHFAGGAASGAIDAEIMGGDVGVGALVNGISAGASEWAGESTQLFKLTGNYMTDVIKQAALGGVIGGAASTAFGGSFLKGFENGAETSAIAYTANDWMHDFHNFLDKISVNANVSLSAPGGFRPTFRAGASLSDRGLYLNWGFGMGAGAGASVTVNYGSTLSDNVAVIQTISGGTGVYGISVSGSTATTGASMTAGGGWGVGEGYYVGANERRKLF